MFRNRTNITTSTDTEPATVDTAPLPTTADDPDSWFFVPDELRTSWNEHAAAAPLDQVGEAIKWTARTWALAEADDQRYEAQAATAQTNERGEKFTRRGDEWVPLRRRLVDRGEGQPHAAPAQFVPGRSLMFSEDILTKIENTLLTDHYAAVREAAEHSLRMRHVVTMHDRQERLAARAAVIRRDTLCPVCGEHDRSGLDVPRRRSLRPDVDARTTSRDIITSCAPCFLTAQRLFAELCASTTLLAHLGRAREDVVRAALIRAQSQGTD